MKRSIQIIVVAFIALTNSANAQTVIGKYAGELLAIGVGGRALGMGGAHAAVVNDVTAGYWNPAGLAYLDYPQISLMHEEHFGNLVNYNYAAVAVPYGKDITMAVSAMRLSVDGIPDTRNALIDRNTGSIIYNIDNPAAVLDPSKVKEFNNTDWAFYLSFAHRYSDKLFWGANIKILQRGIAEYTATGIGFDIGAVYEAADNFFLGANLQDITTTLVAWSTGRNELITPTAKIGTAYRLAILGGVLTPAVDFDLRFEGREFASQFNVGPVSFDMHSGIEFNYKDLFAVRGGFTDVKQFTVGAGIKLPKLNIDYSFARMTQGLDSGLDDTHRISLILTLETEKYRRK